MVVPCQAGLHMTTVLRDQSRDDGAIVRAAAEEGLAVESLSAYAVGGAPRGIVLGYGAVDPTTIRPGLARLAALLA